MNPRSATLDSVVAGSVNGQTYRFCLHSVDRASDLGRRFPSAQPTISKHLKVLEEAGLVRRTVQGRIHRFTLRRQPLLDAERWLARHQAFWNGALTQLDRLLSEAGDGS